MLLRVVETPRARDSTEENFGGWESRLNSSSMHGMHIFLSTRQGNPGKMIRHEMLRRSSDPN